MTFEVDGLTKAARQPDDRITVYELSDGSLFPVARPPALSDGTHGPEVQEPARIVREALGHLASVDGRRREAMADPALSSVGRTQRIEEMRRIARVGLEMARAELEKTRIQAERLEGELFAPPRLAEEDLAGALIDQEIRRYARGLKGEALSRYAAGLAEAPRHLAAILRSPVPLPAVSDHAAGVWRDSVMAGHPRAAPLGRLKEAVRWAEGLLPHIAERV
jgi:hypothetical protein